MLDLEADGVHRIRAVTKNAEGFTCVYKTAYDSRIAPDSQQDTLAPIISAIGMNLSDTFGPAKDKINIVISNSFVMSANFSERNKKGISTKGVGRGNGLYYASNILSKSKWLEPKQEVIDDYYIQTLSIKKLD